MYSNTHRSGNTTSKLNFGNIKVMATGSGGSTNSYMSFHNSNGSERMRLDGDIEQKAIEKF